ncbi:MAG: GHMP family kinase ATP-binding protein [Methanoculleaceae archaeon]
MPKMMIRGGDLDLVEYDFEPFEPGEAVNTCGFEGEYPISPVTGTVVARAPARIHISVLDMNRFSPERPGGGGFGFALQIYSTAEVRCTPDEITIDYDRRPILDNLVEAFRKTVGYTGGFEIRARDHQYQHVGLGSTGSIYLATAHAMNRALGSPLTSEQIRLLIGANYVEETADGRVVHGFETGVGPAAATYGGMAITGDELSLVFHHPFAEDANVFIVIPPTDISSAGEEEFSLLMNRARSLDYRDRELKAYLILMDLIPALVQRDLGRVGDIVWEIEFRGSKRAEVEHHGFGIYRYMALLREAGMEFVAMSSVGPSIAVITRKDEGTVSDILREAGLEIALVTAVDNTGVTTGVIE